LGSLSAPPDPRAEIGGHGSLQSYFEGEGRERERKERGENGGEGRGENCLLFMSLLATHLAISLKSEKERLLTVEERAICNVSVLMG